MQDLVQSEFFMGQPELNFKLLLASLSQLLLLRPFLNHISSYYVLNWRSNSLKTGQASKAFWFWTVLERSTTRVQRVRLYSSIAPALRRSSKAFQKTYWLKLDRVQRLFGSGRFWNDQPHAYNGSGCIPPSLQSYKGCCNALKLDRGTKDHTLTTCPVVFLNGFGATKVIKGISKSHSLQLDRVQRLFGSGWFWNDQPHAYNESGCIPPLLQCYEGHRRHFKKPIG